MNPNPWPAKETLHHDFTKAEAAQLNDDRREAAAALLIRSGCLSDAVTVYHGVDPVHEVDAQYMKGMSSEEEFKEFFERSVVGVHAAEILLGSVSHPGYFDHRHSRRVRELSKIGDWYKSLLRGEVDTSEETPYRNIYKFLNEVVNTEISTDHLVTMNQGAEMLSSALTWWQGIAIKIHRSDPESYKKDIRLQNVISDNQEELARSVMAVQRVVKLKAFDNTDFGADPIDTLERAAIGLRAQWRIGSIMLHPYFRIANGEKIGSDLTELVDTVNEAFIEKRLIDVKKYDKGTVKGLLHEAIWFIDANMLMASQPEHFGTTGISASAHRFDRPMQGFPEHRRGFDYGIADVSDYISNTQLLNLKSGRHYAREYHPRVKQVIEDNFDIGERSLCAKLVAYRKIIDSAFTHPDTEKLLQKYVLPTVKEELAPYRKESIDPGWAFI